MWKTAHAGALDWTLPPQGSEIAVQWDSLYGFIFWLSMFFLVLVVGLMLVFVVKYRKRPGVKPKFIEGNVPLEIVWTAVPTVLLLGMFAWGWVVYRDMATAPANAMEIRVIGKQWLWQFQYEDGRVTTGELFVPVGKPIKLLMTSDDVLHSFFIPNFRVKKDVVPGMYTSLWFEPTRPGRHVVFCAEYCGGSHSGMLAQVIALDPKQWSDWSRGKKIDISKIEAVGFLPPAVEAGSASEGSGEAVGLAQAGKALTLSKGCIACHSDTGVNGIGPSYKGLFGREEDVLPENAKDSIKVKVDENYLRESIEYPLAKKVVGFNPVMPVYKGQISETEMNAIIAYIKSLK